MRCLNTINNSSRIGGIFIGVSILLSISLYPNAEATTPSFIDILPDDETVGIECGDPQFVYVTIFNRGSLAKINKDTNTFTIIDNIESSANANKHFYSIARDPATGNIFVNERDNGKAWRFEPSKPVSSAWTRIPLIEQIIHPKVDYPGNQPLDLASTPFNSNPNGYLEQPYTVRYLDDLGVPHTHTLFFESTSRGVVYANGYIWISLNYELSPGFADPHFTEITGLLTTDFKFDGIVRVDPNTLEVLRIPISSVSLATMNVDSVDNSILWIPDLLADKIYMFDTDTLSVVKTIDLLTDLTISAMLIPGQFPNHIANNEYSIFVALNKDFFSATNSEILQIERDTLGDPLIEASIIDTGAPILDEDHFGTFSVFINNDLLVWTDQSKHVGIIEIGSNEIPTIKQTFDTVTEFNHFGCVPVDGEFWFAGRGSAKVGIIADSKFSVGRPKVPQGRGGGGRGWDITDDTPPTITGAFMTSNDNLCINTADDTGVVEVTVNSNVIEKWQGSYSYFCTNEDLPPTLLVTAKDAYGNKVEKIVIDTNKIGKEYNSITSVSKELNPHHGIEGILINAEKPIKQIRISKSGEFGTELYISEKAIQVLNGTEIIEVIYNGAYKEKTGQIYVSATNMGIIGVFDVIIKDDIRLYLQQKKTHQMYDVEIHDLSVLEKIELNALQRVELERALEGNELSIVQENILVWLSEAFKD